MERFTAITDKAREKFGKWFIPVASVVILLLLFFVAGGGVSQNDRWRIDNIEITGASTVSVDEIRKLVQDNLAGNYFFVYARENIYFYPKNKIEDGILDAFPRLIKAHVSRVGNHTIEVSVSERKPYALWCGEDYTGKRELADCWFIDSVGFVFDRAPVFSDGVYVEVYGKLDEKNENQPLRDKLPHSRFVAADTVIQMARTDIGDSLRIEIKEEGETYLTFRSSVTYPFLSGVVVRFKEDRTPTFLVHDLLGAMRAKFPDGINLKKKLLYIDMRFGNKIFFGFEQ